MNDKVRQLQEQIAAEQSKMARCKHEFDGAYSNPETTREGYGSRLVGHGSDVWSEYEGYRDVTKPRWTRKCSICGFEEHTYKQKPIIEGYEPNF